MDAPAASRLDQVLRAARTLPQPFTKEALVVRTWELYPARFGLAGFSHPDANAVYVALAKLIHRRDLVRECASVYTLSPPNESSMARSSSRTTTPSLPPPEPVALTDAELYRLQDLAASRSPDHCVRHPREPEHALHPAVRRRARSAHPRSLDGARYEIVQRRLTI